MDVLRPIIGWRYYESLSLKEQGYYKVCEAPHGISCLLDLHYILRTPDELIGYWGVKPTMPRTITNLDI